jgi:hypothetical protein
VLKALRYFLGAALSADVAIWVSIWSGSGSYFRIRSKVIV